VRAELSRGDGVPKGQNKRRQPAPVVTKTLCRLEGCENTGNEKYGGACYQHRTVPASETVAPQRALCEVEGCERAVKALKNKTSTRCREHPAYRLKQPKV